MKVTLVEPKLAEPDPVRLLNVNHRAARGDRCVPPRRTIDGVLGAGAIVPSRQITRYVVTMHSLRIAP